MHLWFSRKVYFYANLSCYIFSHIMKFFDLWFTFEPSIWILKDLLPLLWTWVPGAMWSFCIKNWTFYVKKNIGIIDEIKSFIFRSTSLSVADSPSVWHFSSHMGQLLRHSADSMGSAPIGCAMLWPNCPYSSDKLMQISTKVRLRWHN